jgi:hydroxypyruvate reductase
VQPDRFLTQSLRDYRIARVLDAALRGVDPGVLVRQALMDIPLPPHKRAFLLGIGKAAEAMTRSAAETLGSYSAGLVVTKHRISSLPPHIRVMEAGHPVPDRRSLDAGRAVLRFVSRLQHDDLLICLVSGGGSSLVAAPVPGVTLGDLGFFTTQALASGASIEEINAVRRRVDRIKGGGLAAATRAAILSLILSDVIGDRLEAIASGPTAPDPTDASQAIAILHKYDFRGLPSMARAITQTGAIPRELLTDRVMNIIVGNGGLAAHAAAEQARSDGIPAEILETPLQGEARNVGRELAGRLAQVRREGRSPFCLLAVGETTVTLAGHGKGGRNQELALAAVDILSGENRCMLVALATDGNDGPTDAAGAVVTGTTRARALQLGMDSNEYLENHDAYPYFDALGDLLRPGYTGTNVNDITFLFSL